MEGLTKEEKNQYILNMIKNLIYDQTAFNIDNRPLIHSFHEMHSLMQEEHEETIKELEWLDAEKAKLWELIKADKEEREILKHLNCIVERIISMIQEAVHEAAVAQKVLTMLESKEKAPVGGNQTDADKK